MENRKYNSSLNIDAPFEPDRVKGEPPHPSLKCDEISTEFISKIIKNLDAIKNYYAHIEYADEYLVTIHYSNIAAKSNRVQRFFCVEKEGFKTIVGSKYETYEKNTGELDYRNVVTYCISKTEFSKTYDEINEALKIVKEKYNGVYKKVYLDKGNKIWQIPFFKTTKLCKSNFEWLMHDLSSIDHVDVLLPDFINTEKDNLVTFFPFRERSKIELFLRKLLIEGELNFIDDFNIILKPSQLKILFEKAPYIICMNDDDFSSYETYETDIVGDNNGRKLPEVDNTVPTIGVFDTMFEQNCYLKDYVTFENLTSDEYLKFPENMVHGTKVDSILIEGNKLNPDYEDNCGYFKVLHFGVGGKHKIDVPALLKGLEEKVKKYCTTVKVWNLSLGDERGVNPNYVSLLGAKIDEISRKYNVLFVVAGTNISKKYKDLRIGSPADSFNALVVNAVVSKNNKKIADYTRKGPVLTFYQKPDVCYYGGDKDEPLVCYSPKENDYYCHGTSFAAPFIARKAAYLIHKMHLSVECTKAMIIDAAYGWGDKSVQRHSMGYGIVPITIEEVALGKQDEIKMIFSGKTLEQSTLVHDLPLMLDDEGKFCYKAKLTFCYFTYGSRNQGVDYTDQEISVKFGRSYKQLNGKDNIEHYKIDSINEDKQGDEEGYVGENSAIRKYGKWNNTKILIKKNIRRKTEFIYNDSPWWGIMIGHLDRFSSISSDTWENNPDSVSVKFGIIATLKTCDGSNADVDTYVKKIRSNINYHVKEIDIDIQNKIANQESFDIDFE